MKHNVITLSFISFSFLSIFGMLYSFADPGGGGGIAADAEERFRNHGAAAPIAQRAWGGPNTAEDEQGNSLVLLPFILPSNALLVINADTGETEQFDVTEPPGTFYMRYHTLSRDANRWYTTVGRSFREFDINQREWTMVEDIPFPDGGSRDGRGMFEGEDGTLWIACSPNSELISFDPESRELNYHGILNEEDWNQHPDGLAMDDRGWIYAAIVFTKGNLAAYDTRTGERRQLIEEEDRIYAAGQSIFRATDGRVYARLRPRADDPTHPGQWYRLYDGEAEAVDEPAAERAYFNRTGWHNPMKFPDGRELVDYSLIRRRLTIEDPETGTRESVSFDYEVEGGANIYSLIEGPEGMIYGSSGTPLMFFRLDPESGEIDQLGGLGEHGGHINAKAALGGRVYGAV